jgi:hypothetical protein
LTGTRGINSGDLLAVANKYNISGLKAICPARMAKSCDFRNCVEDLILGHLHNDFNVLPVAVQILLQNRKSIMESEEWLAMRKDHPKVFKSICSVLI